MALMKVVCRQLVMLEQIMTDTKSVYTVDSIVTQFRKMTAETRSLFLQVEELLRLLLVVPASSAGAERSFSLLRRIKSYLRSILSQRRLNHYAC